MARSSVVFLSLQDPSQEAAESVAGGLARLFPSQRFRLVTSLMESDIRTARSIYDVFRPETTISSLWNPMVKENVAMYRKDDLQRVEGWKVEEGHNAWDNDNPAPFRLRLRSAIESLHSSSAVVCAPHEVIAACLSLLGLSLTREYADFVVVSNLASAKRKVAAEICGSGELRKYDFAGIAEDPNLGIVAELQTQEESIRRVFLNSIPADDEGPCEVPEFEAKLSNDFRVLAGKLAQAHESAKKVVAGLGSQSQSADRSLAEVAGKLNELCGRQTELERRTADSLSGALLDIKTVSQSLHSLESQLYRDKTELAALKVQQPQKRLPLKVVSVTTYAGKVVAKVDSYRHYQSYAWMYIVANGQPYKEGLLEIQLGERSVQLCDRAEIGEGTYTLMLYNHPARAKAICETVEFTVTPLAERNYQESFLYANHKEVEELERRIMEKGGQDLLDAFRSVASAWSDVDETRIPGFIDAVVANEGITGALQLREVLQAQGFTFVD